MFSQGLEDSWQRCSATVCYSSVARHFERSLSEPRRSLYNRRTLYRASKEGRTMMEITGRVNCFDTGIRGSSLRAGGNQLSFRLESSRPTLFLSTVYRLDWKRKQRTKESVCARAQFRYSRISSSLPALQWAENLDYGLIRGRRGHFWRSSYSHRILHLSLPACSLFTILPCIHTYFWALALVSPSRTAFVTSAANQPARRCRRQVAGQEAVVSSLPAAAPLCLRLSGCFRQLDNAQKSSPVPRLPGRPTDSAAATVRVTHSLARLSRVRCMIHF